MNTQSFTDIQGTLWTVVVTVGTIKRIKQTLGIDLLDVTDFSRRVQDPIALCDLLYTACRPDADRLGIDDAAFAERLLGTALRDAKSALWEAYIHFIPDPAAAEKVRVVREKLDKIGEKILETLEAKMPKIIARLDAETEKLVAAVDADIDRRLSGEPSTSLPPSPDAATPRKKGRSANSAG